MRRLLAAFTILLIGLVPARGAKAPPFEQRWFYAPFNLLVDKNVDELLALMRRAKESGYNGVLLADYKFNILGRMDGRYFKNVERVKKAADELGLELVPTVFPIGYSDGLLAHDPNLAEGLPARDVPFVVKGKEARLDPAVVPVLRNADLEDTNKDRFAGFSFQDDPGVVSFVDREIAHHGKASCRLQDIGKGTSGNGRLVQRVRLRPHAPYVFSAWVKTQDLRPAGAKLLAVGAKTGRTLTFHESHLKPTQDWTEMMVPFNTLEDEEVSLYVGQWGGKSGKLWIDDLKLEAMPLVNVLRREGCPVTVASADGKTEYEEGKDFEAVRDPKLGMVPYAGQFSFRHEGPALRLTAGSRIKDGEHLRVSWYHPVQVHGAQMACCLSDPKVYELMRDQARRVHELLRPKAYMMSHDEIRVANWCKACQAAGKSPGAMLADNAQHCIKIIRDIDSKATIMVWNDMFDPHHNAVEKYYLVNGSWVDSWKGLPADVVIVNWNGGKADKSLKFFADRGHRQIIAGYYDGDTSNFRRWAAAARGVPRVTGFIYTTWQHKYGDLEAYGKLMSGKE